MTSNPTPSTKLDPVETNAPTSASGADVATRPRGQRWLFATVRELATFCRQHRLWTAMITLFIATWTIELYWLQAHTLVYPNDTGARFAMWAPKIRLALDLLFVASVTMALRRRWLIPAVIVSFFVYLSLLTYFNYFYRPISLLTITTSWREGLQVGGFAWDMFPREGAILLLVALAIKLTALILSRKDSLPRQCAWLAAGTFLAGYIGLYATANYLDPLRYIQSTRGVGRLGHIRGYLGPWFAEWYYLRNEQLLDEMLERRKVVYNSLTPIEADIPIHPRLVIVQAESLDNKRGSDAVPQRFAPRVDVLSGACDALSRIGRCRFRGVDRCRRLASRQLLQRSGLPVQEHDAGAASRPRF